MVRTLFLAAALLTLGAVPAQAQSLAAQVAAWLGGTYDNTAQQAATAELPEDKRPLPQWNVMVPVDLPEIGDHVFFATSSANAGFDPVQRRYLMVLSDVMGEEAVLLETLNFRDRALAERAGADITALEGLRREDLAGNPECAFILRPLESGEGVTGDMIEMPCPSEVQVQGRSMVVTDTVTITPEEFWFDGKFFFADDMSYAFGNPADEPIRLIRTER